MATEKETEEHSEHLEAAREEQEAAESAVEGSVDFKAEELALKGEFHKTGARPPFSVADDPTVGPLRGEASGAADSYEQKAQNYWDQLLRLQAEFANYRKRTEKEKLEAIRFGREIMVEKMISLMDVMEEALKHSQIASLSLSKLESKAVTKGNPVRATEGASTIDSLRTGFQMVVQEFLRLLKSEGAEPLNTAGETFDPHKHEAVEQIETGNEDENNIVLEEVQKGYSLNGRLLRPAKVKVAKFEQKARST